MGTVQNIMGVLYSCTTFLGMFNMMSVMPILGYERSVMYRSATPLPAAHVHQPLASKVVDRMVTVMSRVSLAGVSIQWPCACPRCNPCMSCVSGMSVMCIHTPYPLSSDIYYRLTLYLLCTFTVRAVNASLSCCECVCVCQGAGCIHVQLCPLCHCIRLCRAAIPLPPVGSFHAHHLLDDWF